MGEPIRDTTILSCPKCQSSDGVCGVQIRGVHDGVLYWECMECGTRWHRFDKDHYLYGRAAEHIGHVPEEV